MSPDRDQFEATPPASPGDASAAPPETADASGSPEPADVATPARAAAQAAGSSRPARAQRSVRYPNAYVWFIFLAALDVMLTYLILHPVLFFRDPDMTESRGTEVNALADWIIERWDVPGVVVFKFTLVVLVVILCEIIGRHKDETGRRIAEWAVAITAIPVIIALIQMGFDLYFWFHPPH
ncbi:MAG: hypothetical protein ACE5I3_04430 [Phycisphaerae bacterium]